MFGSRWVITPLWLSELWRSFLYSTSVYSCHLFLISSASVRSILFLSFSTSFKRSCAPIATLSAPDAAAGHHQPMPLPETPGHSWASLGQCLVGSLLFSPGYWCVQGFVCALQESVSQSCVSSGSSMVGLIATSFKRAYTISRSAAPRAPAPEVGHCWPIPTQETVKYSSGSVSEGSLGLGVHKVCLSPSSISGRYGVWL